MRFRIRAFTLIELLIVVAIIAILAAIAVPNFLEARVRAQVSRIKADERTYATAIEAYAVDWNQYMPLIHIGDVDPPQPPISPLQSGLELSATFWINRLESILIPLSTPVSYLSEGLIFEPSNAHEGWLMYQGWDVLSNQGPPPDKGQRQTIYMYLSLPGDAFISGNLGLVADLLALIGGNCLPPGGCSLDVSSVGALVARRWFMAAPGPDTFYSFDRCVAGGGNVGDGIVRQLLDVGEPKCGGMYDPTNGTISQGEIVRTGEGIAGMGQ